MEWVVTGAAGINVQFFYFDGALPILTLVENVGPDLYIYSAYTQPDDLGQEVGGSNFALLNLTSFNAHYGLAVSEVPVIVLPMGKIKKMLPQVDGKVGGGKGGGHRNRLIYDGTTISVIADAVPEASTWVLMAVGLGALSFRGSVTRGRRA